MAAPYSTQTISGYNSNPPADDGSATSANRVLWSTIKTKLADPPKVLAQAIDTALVTSFTKVIGGGGVTTYTTDSTIQSTDQGKLVRFTGGTAVTLADATTVTSPFVHAYVNDAGATQTLTGPGGQTINGNASVTCPAGSGCFLFTDGSNWFTSGLPGTLVGKQLMYGDIINGTIVESNGSNAVTFALKTLAGNDPSSGDPVLICFRSATLGLGTYVYRTVTAATSLVISSGSTLGFTSGVAGRVWLVLFDDGGTVRIGAINCLSGTSIYPLGRVPRVSATSEGGAGGADSAQVFYANATVSSKAYLVWGHADYESGLATAGAWNASPTNIQLIGPSDPLPGTTIQVAGNATGAVATGTTATPHDDSIPAITEGDQYMTQAITPTSAANLLRVDSEAIASNSNNSVFLTMALHQDATSAALTAKSIAAPTGTGEYLLRIAYDMVAATTSATTMRIRIGCSTGATTTFNGASGGRIMGGVQNSFIRIVEIMA